MINYYKVKDRILETSSTITLHLVPQSIEMTIPLFEPGQYITLHLLENSSNFMEQGKSYTISSTPHEPFIAITVKKNGKFSEKLHNLKLGELIGVSGPCGWFTLKKGAQHNVYLAGGIGITPFRSMLRSATLLYPDRKFTLFYSNGCLSDIVFKNELNEIAKNNKNVSIIFCITREIVQSSQYENGRINLEFLKKYLGNLFDKNYFICGSLAFVNDMRNMLEANSIRQENIQVEIF